MSVPLKGLILSGGKGSRLRPFTYTNAKQLVPIANKPVLFYAIEQLVECGIRDIGIVVGDTEDQIRAAVGDGSAFGACATFIQQDAPLGIAHAVKVACDYLGDSPFVLYLGDNFLLGGIRSFVERFIANGANNYLLTVERATGQVLATLSRPGRMAGELKWVHNLAIDSKGNLYTAEVGTGRRAQKFVRQ